MTIEKQNEEDLIEVEIEQPAPPEIEAESPPAEQPPPPEENEAVRALKAQVDQLQADHSRELRARQEAERRAASAETDVVDSRLTAIDNALEAKKVALAEAKRQFKRSMEEADYTKIDDLQQAIAETVNQINALENGKIELERQKTEPRQQRTEVPRDQVDDYISQQSPRTQEYLRRHTELVTNPRLNQKVVAGHYLAVSEGIQPDTDAYFSYIDKHMGYAQPEAGTSARTTPAAPVQRASAPVSRGSKDSLPKLTPGEAQTADALGISRAEYAKRKLAMSRPDWNGPRFNDGYTQ